ncbi:MAG TPA: glutamine synthetase family protein [Burkholderiales bacterium]|jgi:glutamine synthetase
MRNGTAAGSGAGKRATGGDSAAGNASASGNSSPAAQAAALADCARQVEQSGVELVRFAWCDTHGQLRGKTLTTQAAVAALRTGVSMVSTLMLKDTADRTAFKVFEPGIAAALPGFEFANNVQLHALPGSFHVLPWAQSTGWLQCQPVFHDGAPAPYDTRAQLQRALARLAEQGLTMVCGLEIEFHIYRLRDPLHDAAFDPAQSAWPPPAPAVSLIHPGYRLLAEDHFDLAEEPLRIVQHTAQALGLPLASLEIELGPSQVEAVFSATDALVAADNMVLFRSAVKQSLRRAGYHATFMCRPPFDNIMSSGWHLHQSLVQLDDGRNAFMREAAAAGSTRSDARHTLSDLGAQYLAGLLQHAKGMTVLCTPTVNGFGRFRPNALAPQSILWGLDNRGAMLRVIGGAGDAATRIENRLGEPAANPYLYMAAQIHAGLAGVEQNLAAPPATESPYADTQARIPATLPDALAAFAQDSAMSSGFGADFVRWYSAIKASEQQRYEAAEDKTEFQRREYFGRI